MSAWAALLALAAAQGGPATYVYACSAHRSLPAGLGGVDLTRIVRADGALVSASVEWTGAGEAIVQRTRPRDGLSASLKWPGTHLFGQEGKPIDWDVGSLDVFYLADGDMGPKRARKEPWMQTFIDRDGSLPTVASGGDRYLSLITGLHLASVPNDVHSPTALPIADLFAWDSGKAVLIAHVVRFGRRPTQPGGGGRVIGTYRIDLAALRDTAAAVRREAEAWEATVRDPATACPRQVWTDPRDVIVTDQPVRS